MRSSTWQSAVHFADCVASTNATTNPSEHGTLPQQGNHSLCRALRMRLPCRHLSWHLGRREQPSHFRGRPCRRQTILSAPHPAHMQHRGPAVSQHPEVQRRPPEPHISLIYASPELTVIEHAATKHRNSSPGTSLTYPLCAMSALNKNSLTRDCCSCI